MESIKTKLLGRVRPQKKNQATLPLDAGDIYIPFVAAVCQKTVCLALL
jgi:hypothetical protein